MIKIKNLEKSYKGHKIFDNFHLEIPSGKMVGIYGPSGAGKSTLLNIIGLIEDYDDGEYYFDGSFAPAYNSPRALKLRRHHISYLFQNFALIEDESIEKNLNVSLLYAKVSKKEKRRKMKKFLNQVHIRHPLSTKIYSLSGGEKQRVALARALLKESKLILADEPTGSLDLGNKKKVIDLLKDEVKKGKTVLIVTHDPSIKEECDLIIDIA
ncbi:putative bacteriocin export ABC transporter [Lactococcus ileimucosae]|uniref:putative bacteriocin export ABC transporter n=1 Tax=Lactococcus ileimucosae TaxID=2941329 RepID=UPI00204325FB|nr:putative bacteriocin export ABC transporter [Lactococcus ileimucosae]